MKESAWVLALVGSLALAVLPSSAAADWIYDTNTSAFSDDATHLALTARYGYGVGIRCSTADLSMLFTTPDPSFSADLVRDVNGMGPELLMRVDDNDVMRLFGELQLSSDGTMMIAAFISPAPVEQLQNARQRVSVAIEVAGQLFHEQEFSVAGSTAVMDQIRADCVDENW